MNELRKQSLVFGTQTVLNQGKSSSHTKDSSSEEWSSIANRDRSGLIISLDLLIQETISLLKEISQPASLFSQAKASFLKLAEREVEREIQEILFEFNESKETLNSILLDLKKHRKGLHDNSERLSSQSSNTLKEKISKTSEFLEKEKRKTFRMFDLEIVSKSAFEESKEKIKKLQREIEESKFSSHELAPDTARISTPQQDASIIQEIDEIICQRIKDLTNLIQTISQSRPQGLSLVARSPDFDPNFPLRCFDSFRLLEGKILAFLRAYTQGVDFESYDEVGGLKELVQTLSQENLLMKEKLVSFKSLENEMSLLIRNKELSFEEKLSQVRQQSHTEKTKLREALGQLDSNNQLKSRISQLESDLKSAQEEKRSPVFERELENVRKIYNDKYEELFRITSSQISELELRLRENETQQKSIFDEVKNQVRHENFKLREQEITRISQLHQTEIRAIQSEFEDFLNKSRLEINKLGRLVEKAIQNSDYKLLSSIQEDISYFNEKLEHQAVRVRDEGLVQAEYSCSRCGLNDKKSQVCAFHPYLVGADAQELLYSTEWHKCREARHDFRNDPCVVSNRHLYKEDARGYYGDCSASRNRGQIDTPNRTLQEALFSDQKASNESATDLLDFYLAKHA